MHGQLYFHQLSEKAVSGEDHKKNPCKLKNITRLPDLLDFPKCRKVISVVFIGKVGHAVSNNFIREKIIHSQSVKIPSEFGRVVLPIDKSATRQRHHRTNILSVTDHR